MNTLCNTASALPHEHFHGAGELGESASRQPAALAVMPHAPQPPKASAAACVRAAAVMDVVEQLTQGHAGEAAIHARTGANWGLMQAHRRHWTARMPAGDQARATLCAVGSLGMQGLVTPGDLHLCADGNLWVSGFGSQQLAVLSPEGALLRRIELPGAQPWGLFTAGDGTPWVCDYAKPRLTRFGLDGTVQEVVEVRTQQAERHLRPIFGVANGAELYLILSDGQARNRRLARLSPESNGWAELLPCPVAVPSAIRICGDRLIVAGQVPPAVMSRPLSGGEWTRLNTGLLPDYLTGLICMGGELWVAARGLLARLGPGGAVEEVMDAGAMAGYPGGNLVGMAVRPQGHGHLLYLADNIHDLVHIFRLRPQHEAPGVEA